MESETFQIRVSKLIQKSRKAVRLYSTHNLQGGHNDIQISEWKDVNMLLLQGLTNAMNSVGRKNFVASVFALRDRFFTVWQSAENDLRKYHEELVLVAKKGDFVRVTNLGEQLIAIKARLQAAQAAHHELQDLLDKSHVASPVIELSHQSMDEGALQENNLEDDLGKSARAKVIPLRRKCAN